MSLLIKEELNDVKVRLTSRCRRARQRGAHASASAVPRRPNATLDIGVRDPRGAQRRRAGEAVALSLWVAALQPSLYDASRLVKARWRGGVLKDALSNNTMQRSAIRTVHLASLYRSRPLMVSVRRFLRAHEHKSDELSWSGPKGRTLSRAEERTQTIEWRHK